MEVEPLINLIFQYGFPAVVAFYLLIRLEAKLDVLENVIRDLQLAIEMMLHD